jgi:hypothetical protein
MPLSNFSHFIDSVTSMFSEGREVLRVPKYRSYRTPTNLARLHLIFVEWRTYWLAPDGPVPAVLVLVGGCPVPPVGAMALTSFPPLFL